MKHSLAITLTYLITSLPLLAQESPKSSESEKKSRQSIQSIDVKQKLEYLLYLPADYESESSTKKWPLLIFLHGAGERGSDIAVVKKHGPPKRVAEGTDFPFIVVSPQCPPGGFWNTDHLLELVKQVMKEQSVDPDRVYLTGLSMGGYGSWGLAAKAPEMFAAVAPVCGGGDPKTAPNLKDLPIWVFHGDADRVVPVTASQEMVDAVKAAGGENIKFTIYEGVGHDSWTETYANEELYTWFLKHKRKGK